MSEELNKNLGADINLETGDIIEDKKSEQQQESVEDTEFELTPEIEAKIMEKVVDIDLFGLAYSQVPIDRLPSILQFGLLGSDWENRYETKVDPDSWSRNARNKKAMHVFANIVGRSGDERHTLEPEIKNSFYIRNKNDALVILFDIKGFNEDIQQERGKIQKQGTYRADTEGFSIQSKDFPDTQFGYQFAYRVSPRFFRGIIFKKLIGLSREADNIEKQRYASTLSGIETGNVKKGELLPVYDDSGNLFWPREMSYDDVKKFVAERDKAKESEQETEKQEGEQ